MDVIQRGGKPDGNPDTTAARRAIAGDGEQVVVLEQALDHRLLIVQMSKADRGDGAVQSRIIRGQHFNAWQLASFADPHIAQVVQPRPLGL